MRFFRIIAAALAMMLVCVGCLAEDIEGLQTLIDGMIDEALNGGSESDDEYNEYTAELIPELDMSLDDWLSTSYMRSVFSVLLMVEMMDVEEYDIDALIDEYGVPTVYVAGPAEGDFGEPIYAFYFFTDGDTGRSLNVIYYTSDSTYSGFVADVYGDNTTYIDYFYEEGICGEYYEVSAGEFSGALNDLNDIINED